MAFNKNEIIDLSTDMVYYYDNDLSPEENLITTYICETKGSTQIHNKELRIELNNKIVRGDRSIGLGDFATLRKCNE